MSGTGYIGVARKTEDSASLEELGLTAATVTALKADGIENVGQLWREFIYGGYLPQIGAKRSTEIRKALGKSGRLTRKPWTEYLLQDVFSDPVDRKFVLTDEGEAVLIHRLILWLAEDSRHGMVWLVALRYGIGRFHWSDDFRVLSVDAVENGRYTFSDPMTPKQIAEECELTPHQTRSKLRAAMEILRQHKDELWDIFYRYRLQLD